jgi:ABC-2 type transport system ATP-binding protein
MTAIDTEPAEGMTSLRLPGRHDLTFHLDTAASAVAVDGLCKQFGPSRFSRKKQKKAVLAVDNVSFQVRRGEIYGILGANGSGKSTLIRILATLLFADSGTATIFGLDIVNDAAQVKHLINRVSVEASLFKKLSAMENLMYAARLYSVNPRQAREDIERVLPALGIPASRIKQPVEKMSRGMQQKVAIARALLTSPVLLLLDEPTTGLDPRSKKDVERFVLSLRDTHDATILLTSHDMHEADTLCDRLAILDKGRIVVEGSPAELKEQHRAKHNTETPPSLEDIFMEVTGRSLEEDEEPQEDDGDA